MVACRAAALLLFAAPFLARGTEADDAVSLLQHKSGTEDLATIILSGRGDDTVRLTVKDERNRELHLEVRTSTRLGKLIDVVCKRLGLEKEYAMFVHDGKLLSQFDTVGEFGLFDQDVIDVSGGRVRLAPRREVVATTLAPVVKNTTEVSQEAVTAKPTAAPVAKPVHHEPVVFQIGDFIYVNISNGTDSEVISNTWAPCSVAGKGSLANTYNIHFLYTPTGFRDLIDVPSTLLRKVDGRRFAEAIQYYREDVDAVDQVANFVSSRREAQRRAKEAEAAAKAAEEEAAKAAAAAAQAAAAAAARAAAVQSVIANNSLNATAPLMEEIAAPEPERKENFQVGDFMEIRLEKALFYANGNVSWVPCRLLGTGQRNNSYQVHFLFMPASHADLNNISKDFLRKISTKEFASKSTELKRLPQQGEEAVLQLEQEAANRSVIEEQRMQREMEEHLAALAAERADEEAFAKMREQRKEQEERDAIREAAEKKAKRDRELAQKVAEREEAQKLANVVYKDGDRVEVKLDKAYKGSFWIPGTVSSRGREPNSFNVAFSWGPDGHRDIENVPLQGFLRPPSAAFDEMAGKLKLDADAAMAAMLQAEKEAARRVRAAAAEKRAAAVEAGQLPLPSAPEAPLAVNEAAEIKITKSLEGLTWIPCIIASPGKRGTFNVKFSFSFSDKHSKELANVPKDLLRKADPMTAQNNAKLAGSAELAENAIAQLEREASRRDRQEEAARKRREEAKAPKTTAAPSEMS